VRVLAVGAHPDDLEILCGGTLARYVEEGHEVVMCHATTGNRGSFEYTSEEVAAIRDEEAREAARTRPIRTSGSSSSTSSAIPART
jgi:LmbE family N-acetylglucosaminyl deacetylase